MISLKIIRYMWVLGVGGEGGVTNIWPDSSLKDFFSDLLIRNHLQHVGVGCGRGGRCK